MFDWLYLDPDRQVHHDCGTLLTLGHSKTAHRALKLPAYMTPSSVLSGEDHSALGPQGLRQASKQGFLSGELLAQAPSLVILEGLLSAAHSRAGDFTSHKARDYFCYLYLNGWSLSLYQASTPMESFWHNCLTLYFYRMSFARPEVFPEKCASTIQEILNNGANNAFGPTTSPTLDLRTVSATFSMLGGSFPSALIWASLLAGPIDARLRPWFCSLLRIACTYTIPPVGDFDDAMTNFIKPCWLWCDRLTPSAEEFWDLAFSEGVSGLG